MNRWEKEFKEHALHETLNSIIEKVTNKETTDETADDLIEKKRLLKLLTLLRDSLGNIDPEIVDITQMTAINSYLSPNVQQYIGFWINHYIVHGTGSYLVNANDHNQIIEIKNFINNLLVYSKNVLYTKTPELDKAVEQFCKQMENKNNNIEQKSLELSQSIQKQQEKLDELSEQVELKKQELSDLKTEIRTEFNSSQEQRQSTYSTWYENAKQNIKTDIIDKIKESSEKEKEAIFKVLDQYKKEGKDTRDKILELHGLVATDSMTAGYVVQADKEKKEANFWRWSSFAFIICMILWTGGVYIYQAYHGIEINLSNWITLLKPWSVVLMLLYGAIYSSRQSTLHRENEIRTRWFALEVSAIDPYLSSLSDKGQDVKKDVSKKLFGMNHLNKEVKNHISKSSLTDMITTIVKEVVASMNKGDK